MILDKEVFKKIYVFFYFPYLRKIVRVKQSMSRKIWFRKFLVLIRAQLGFILQKTPRPGWWAEQIHFYEPL